MIEDLFYQLVMKLHEQGEVSFKNIFVDETKIEANANRYTFVWKKAVEKNNEKLNQKAENILPVICKRYGIAEYVSIEECYDILSKQAMPFGDSTFCSQIPLQDGAQDSGLHTSGSFTSGML